MPNTKVIDLSDDNIIPESLVEARNAGVVGMIHKATEGTDLVSEKADNRIYLAKEAGMLIGLYHTLTPDAARSQVSFFADTADELGLEDNWLLAVQYDDPAVPAQVLLEFLKDLEKETRRKPVLYAGPGLLNRLAELEPSAKQYPLWLAQYDSVANVPTAWGKYFLWQFTDGENGEVQEVPGVDPPVACSDYLGDEEQLANHWSHYKGNVDDELPEAAAPSEPGEPESGTAPVETPEGELEHGTPEAPPPTDGHEGEADPPPSSQLPAEPKPPGRPEAQKK